MTRNPKPDELPERFDIQLQNNPDVAALVADNRLARADVIARIEAATGLDFDGDSHLTARDMARFLKDASGDTRRVRRLMSDFHKGGLADRIAQAVDADVTIDRDQDAFRKDQLIRVWFAVYEPSPADDSDGGDRQQVEA